MRRMQSTFESHRSNCENRSDESVDLSGAEVFDDYCGYIH
jgi:hypothetical protein